MCLKEARPTVPPVGLCAFYFELLMGHEVKVVCIARLPHDSSGFKTKLSVANNLTFKPDVQKSFCLYGRCHRLPVLKNVGGGHAK